MGYWHDLNPHGLLWHSTWVVTPAKVPLGLLDQPIIYRDIDHFGKKHDRKKRPLEEPESYKWLKNLAVVAEVPTHNLSTLIVKVADRESDVYDYLVHAPKLDNQAVLIRGAWNRCLDDEPNYLWE